MFFHVRFHVNWLYIRKYILVIKVEHKPFNRKLRRRNAMELY